MKDKDKLKKKILYRSSHRGTKEMDLLLGNFVKKYIDSFSHIELKELLILLMVEDEIINKWYFKNETNVKIKNTSIFNLFKNFKM